MQVPCYGVLQRLSGPPINSSEMKRRTAPQISLRLSTQAAACPGSPCAKRRPRSGKCEGLEEGTAKDRAETDIGPKRHVRRQNLGHGRFPQSNAARAANREDK